MEQKVIFLDVDGTLIDYEGKLPVSAREAVIQARKNGHLVYICTGCSKAEIDAKHWDFELDGMIGGNGCYVESHGEVIVHNSLTVEECAHFIKWCEERDMAFRLECNSGMYISEGYEPRSRKARLEYARGKGAALPDDYIVPMNPAMIPGGNIPRDDCNKTAFVLRTYQDFKDAYEEFQPLKVDTWGGKGEHALYGAVGVANVDKAVSIHQLLDYLGKDAKDAIGFGDAKVDIPMFECCGYSVAMGNSGQECLDAADYITDDINEDGLYNAFKYLKLI